MKGVKKKRERQGCRASSGTLEENEPGWHRAMKLEVTELASSWLCFRPPVPGLLYGTDLLEQNVGATVLRLLSAKRSEKDAALSGLSCQLIGVSPFLCAWHCDTQELRERCFDPKQATMPGGAHLSSHGGWGGLESQHRSAKPRHAGLVSLAGKKSPYVSRHRLVGHLQKKTYCIHHERTQVSRRLASSRLLPETSRTLHCSFPGSEREAREVTRLLLLGHGDLKSAFL